MQRRPAPLVAAALAALSLLAACATLPPRDIELEDARHAVAQAADHPLAAHALPELQRAQRSLAAAEEAWAAGLPRAKTRQRAYAAQRQAEIALAVATQAQHEQRAAEAERAAMALRLQQSLRADNRYADAAARRAGR
jgi:hypothetical protein